MLAGMVGVDVAVAVLGWIRGDEDRERRARRERP
jgi:hypothetical protein